MSFRKALIIVILSLAFAVFIACEKDRTYTYEYEEQEDDDGRDDDQDDDDQEDDDDDDDVADDDDDDDLGPPYPCDEIYAQDSLPTFEIVISEQEWEALVYEYRHGMEVPDPAPYHPLISFKYEDEEVNNAAIRLRGSPNHWWPDPKMQFNISFKEYDPNGRFHGLRKLDLDVAHNDWTMFHDRLAASIFHHLGVPCPCTNNVRLVINDEYFGLYVNIEHVDQAFLRRNFGRYDDGNLYKCKSHFIYEKMTNEDDPDTSDLDLFLSEDLDFPDIERVADLDEAVMEWAGEAIIPQMDGYFVGSINFYIYNHPQRGFVFIPWDIDYAFEVVEPYTDPITQTVSWGRGKPHHFQVVIGNPVWYGRYLDAVGAAVNAYDTDKLLGRIDAYSAQTEEAIQQDPNLFYTLEQHYAAVEALRSHVQQRHAVARDWLKCKRGETEYVSDQFQGRTYHFVKTRCGWLNALANCVGLGGTLAVPVNILEQEYLIDSAFHLEQYNWWIGANDLGQEGLWTDPNEIPLTYIPWAFSQPNGGINQNCAVIDRLLGGYWNDMYCEYAYPSVCIMDEKAK